MKFSEAKKMVEILLNADDGCHHCARDLCREFTDAYPEFLDITFEMFNNRFPEKS